MALLSDAGRHDVWAEFQADCGRDRTPLPGVTKAELRAAVDAIDSWLDTNFTALNAAIPQPARAALPKEVKVRLAVAVIKQRYLKGS